MRHAPLGLLLVAAACGGGSRAAQPATATPARPPASVAKPPAEAKPLTLTELRALADELCACTDVTCAQEVNDRLRAAVERSFAEDERDALAAEFDRAMQCFVSRMQVKADPPDPADAAPARASVGAGR